MSYRVLQLSPIKHPHYPQENCSSGFLEHPGINGLDMGSLRSWFEYDSELGESSADGHTQLGYDLRLGSLDCCSARVFGPE